jgi:uncharacterized protein YggE
MTADLLNPASCEHRTGDALRQLFSKGTVMSNVLSVRASAEVTREPDRAFVTLYVRSEGLLMSDAAKSAYDRAQEAVKLLRSQFPSIESIDVSVQKYGEKERGYSDDKSAPGRPEVLLLLLVEVPVDKNAIVAILDLALRNNLMIQSPNSRSSIEKVSSVIYAVDDPDASEEAILAALEQARLKADRIASRLGKRIIQLSGVTSSWEYNSWRGHRNEELAMAIGTRHCSTDPNGVAITATVNADFEWD